MISQRVLGRLLWSEQRIDRLAVWAVLGLLGAVAFFAGLIQWLPK